MEKKKLFKMNHSYRIFLLILCAFLFTDMNASVNRAVSSDDGKEVARYLLVWDKSGGCVSFALEERPCITVDVAQNAVNCVTTKQEISFTLKDIHKYTLDANEGTPAGIENAENEEQLQNKEGSLYFYNYRPNTVIGIYNINGILVSSDKINNDGTLLISTNNLKSGIYLIKAGRTTYKITIK